MHVRDVFPCLLCALLVFPCYFMIAFALSWSQVLTNLTSLTISITLSSFWNDANLFRNKYSDENTLDLHGLHVTEAVEALENMLSERKGTEIKNHVDIVTLIFAPAAERNPEGAS